MNLKQKIRDKIEHAKERQQYWKKAKGFDKVAEIWAGIENELTLVSKDLDEATKQIQEKAKTGREICDSIMEFYKGLGMTRTGEELAMSVEEFKRRELEEWVGFEDVAEFLEGLKQQIRGMKVLTTLEHAHPHPEFWKGWNKAIDTVMTVLEGAERK